MAFKYKTQTAKLKAGPLTYLSAGKASKDAEGAAHLPVLYLHGAGGLFKSLVHEKLAADRKLVMPVTPGHDGTDFVPGIDSMPKLADFVAEFITKKLGGKCDLWGHSFGGWLACWIAATHPELVDLLVLENPAGFRKGGQGGIPKDPDELRRQMFAHPEKRPPDDRPREMVAANDRKVGHYHNFMPLDEALVAKLPDITAPTLILYGLDEEMIPIETPRILSDGIRRHFLVYVYDAKHSIQVDQPERMTKIVRDFFDRGEAFIVKQGKQPQAQAAE
jgi:pimeloyl-ACP methyl ester carboxylesterase